jgi:hypothetical protein
MPVSMIQIRQKVHVEFPPEHLIEMTEEMVCSGEMEKITRDGLVHSRQTANQC